MLKTWRNRLKIKNNDRFLTNTRGITLLHSIFDVLTINGNQLKPEMFTKKELSLFDFKPIPLCLQQWLPIITETSKIQRRMVIPQVIDEN